MVRRGCDICIWLFARGLVKIDCGCWLCLTMTTMVLYGGDCSVCNISGGGLYGRNLVVVCGLDR